jgi:hypothetical protein
MTLGVHLAPRLTKREGQRNKIDYNVDGPHLGGHGKGRLDNSGSDTGDRPGRMAGSRWTVDWEGTYPDTETVKATRARRGRERGW